MRPPLERRDANRLKTFTRRGLLLGGTQLALLSTLAGRLYFLQVEEANRYKVLSDENRISLRLLAPLRGRLLDRFGVEIAGNRQNFRVELVRDQTKSVARTLDALATLIPIDDAVRARVMQEVKHKRGFVPVIVAENLSWDDFSRINVHIPELPGVQLDVGQTRFYPFGQETAHVTGYVAAVSEGEAGQDPLLELPGFRVGRSGVEKVYDLKLRGKAGDSEVEVNAYGRVVRELSRHDGQPGDDLVLTIDAELQRFAFENLSTENSAATVVLDIMTGDILALASVPSFDPNIFAAGISAANWKDLITNPLHPLTNKAIAGQYPPGSTFKPMVAMAGLETHSITPQETLFCNGTYKLGDHVFHCWRHSGHGHLAMAEAIEQSCDVYFYQLAQRIGIDPLAAMAMRFGFGHPTGIDLPDEHGGLIPTKEWKRKVLHKPWEEGETLVAGIGQGYVSVTPIQLALAAARIANGGYAITPRLLRPRGRFDGTDAGLSAQARHVPPLGVSPASIAEVQLGMQMVTSGSRGTARADQIKEPGFAMAGKTGSSQIARITAHERAVGVRKQDQLPWDERDDALFICYAPIQAPRYALAVVVEHGSEGAYAGVHAHDIMLKCQQLDPARNPNRAQVARDGGGEDGGDSPIPGAAKPTAAL